MLFNADTKRLEGPEGSGAIGDFGFEKGTREDEWMSLTSIRLRERFGVSPSAPKKERKLAESRIALLLNRAYDFMFWIDEHDIDFYPISQPRETVMVKVKVGDKDGEYQVLSEVVTAHLLPIDDIMRRIELNPKEVVALGPLMPREFDSETGECTAWHLLAAPIRVNQAELNARRIREQVIEESRRPADFVQPENVLDGVSIVTDSEWVRTHEEQFRRIHQESMETTVRNLSTVVSNLK